MLPNLHIQPRIPFLRDWSSAASHKRPWWGEKERRRGRGGRPLFLFCGGVEKCGNIFRGLLSSSTTAAAAAFRFANILEGAAKSFQHSIGGASS